MNEPLLATERVYIGLGSNLADPAEQLRSALKAIAQLPDCQLSGVSSFYISDSLLPGQPRFTNAVAAVDTALAPLTLLDALQAIELDGAVNATNAGATHAGPRYSAVRRPSYR